MPRPPYHLDAIKAHLARNGEMSATDLALGVELTSGTLFAAVQPGLRNGELVKRIEGRRAYYALAEGVEVETAEEVDREDFRANLDTDGDLDLYGLKELENGGYRVSCEDVGKLRRLLHGKGPEE